MLFPLFLLSPVLAVHAFGKSAIDYQFSGRGSPSAIHDVLSRVLDTDSREIFDLNITGSCSEAPPKDSRSRLCFDIGPGREGKVGIRGTSGPEIAYGAAHYLRKYCGMGFFWNRTGGNNILIPQQWPSPNATTIYRATDVSYFMNVVTFSYTFAFYDFEHWEMMLDWAALGGVNLALAYTGQEEVYRKVFNKFGITNDEFAQWSNGPAYLAWSRGQSMHGIAGPVPLSFFKSQWKLNKQILRRMREIGMVGVLPSFQGNVPPEMRELYPKANMTRKKGTAAWIDGCDPLFGEIADTFLKQVIEDFGTDHWYEADGYFNMHDGPWYSLASKEKRGRSASSNPWSSPEEIPIDFDARAHAKAAYGGMNRTDPKAVWLYQGWIWRGWGADKLPYMKGFVSGVPEGRFVMLDMFDESIPEWEFFNDFSYFGTPFIWSVLHNFGGNSGLWGSLPLLNSQPYDALANSTSVSGVGFAPEGLDQNPAYYQFALDLSFRASPLELDEWPKKWVIERYGAIMDKGKLIPISESAVRAWEILRDSVYGEPQKADFFTEKNHDALFAFPYGPDKPQPDWYNISRVLEAWKALTSASAEISAKRDCDKAVTGHVCLKTLRYDIVNTGREFLSKVSNRFLEQLENATTIGEVTEAWGSLKEIMQDADTLLCGEEGMRFKEWLDLAEKLGNSLGMGDYMILNARAQPTTWLIQTEDSTRLTGLLDYANKHWGGMVGGFYLNRTRVYFEHMVADMKAKRAFNKTAYIEDVCHWSYEWTHDYSRKFHICDGEGEGETDVVETSARLIEKWGKLGKLSM